MHSLISKKLSDGSGEERKAIFLSMLSAVVLLAADQLTKALIVQYVQFASKTVVIPYFFNITHITNTGAAWGIFSGKGWLLLAVSIAVLISMILWFRQLCEGWSERMLALMLIASGIVGNSIDRIFRGEVVDFLQFYVGRFVWPSFNVADSCITVGVIIYVASTVFRPETPKEPKKVSSVLK